MTPYYNSPAFYFLFKPVWSFTGWVSAASNQPVRLLQLCLRGPWVILRSVRRVPGMCPLSGLVVALPSVTPGGQVPAGHWGFLSSLLLEKQGPSEVPLVLGQLASTWGWRAVMDWSVQSWRCSLQRFQGLIVKENTFYFPGCCLSSQGLFHFFPPDCMAWQLH